MRPGYIPANKRPQDNQAAAQPAANNASSAQAARILPDAPAKPPEKPAAPAPIVAPPTPSPKLVSRKSKRRWFRNSPIATAFFTLSLFAVMGFFAILAVGAIAYVKIAQELPDVGQLKARRSTFASSKIYDRDGNFIVEITDPSNPTGGRRTYVPISEISEWVVKATTSTEDPNFYRYTIGFDPVAIVRVIYYLYTEREFVSGGSTITQQVARNLLLSAEERTERTAWRKLREIVLANEMVRRYKRDEILEIYLNEINYGNLAYGIEAASETYFNKKAKDLTLGESALLAGLPQAPSYWDPVASEQRGLRRMQVVLGLMEEAGYITNDMGQAALKEVEAKNFKSVPVNVTSVAPHFMNYLRQQLDEKYGKALYQEPGLQIYTTLDRKVQQIAEQAVKEQIAKLKDKNVNNGAVVVMDPRNGEVLAMVGSADFYNTQIRGQVNVALSLRQPGSTIKPFTYLTQMEKGATPATLYWDVPVSFRNQWGQYYTPQNYDLTFHGPMLMRDALARSMNIPAVMSLHTVGITDFLKVTDRVGIHFPPNPQYGLAITLGGAESRLIDMTAAYASIANQGKYITPTLTSRVIRGDGKMLFDSKQVKGQPVIAPEYAYQIANMLSDNSARAPSFGPNSVLKLNRPAAVKTGTTNDYRDNLAIGFTPDLTVGVWTGNTDNAAMKNVSGIDGAAPIWNQVVSRTLQGKPALDFVRPDNVIEVEICLDGGRAASPYCPQNRRRKEVFKADQGPFVADQRAEYAARVGDQTYVGQLVRYTPPMPGEPTATPLIIEPTAMPATQPDPASGNVQITNPPNGSVLGRGLLSINGIVNPAGFERYQVEWGIGDNPSDWRWISGPHLSPVVNGQLTQWGGIDGLPAGRYAIRITAFTSAGLMVNISHFDVR